ncbi:MAG: 2-amino-4-hydroxy-6-hydroxymethyldihydropteridine diphosphokinase [Burkholderiaceae bacterium]
MAKVKAYIGIGSNLGDSRTNVESAIRALDQMPASRVSARSSLFRTAPVDAGGDDYVNAVAQLETELSSQDLLDALLSVERAFGRERPFQNAPRTLDLDLLLYGNQTITMPSLQVPHPRMTQRAFVLIPLLEIDPFIAIPGKGPAHQFIPGVANQAIRKL